MALDYTMMRDAVNMNAMNRLSRAQGIGESAAGLGFLGADAFKNSNLGQGGLLNMFKGLQNPFLQESIADEATIDNIYKTDGDLPESEMYTNEIPQFKLPDYDSSIKPSVAPYSKDYSGESVEVDNSSNPIIGANNTTNAFTNPYINTSNLVELRERGEDLQATDDSPLYSEGSFLDYLSKASNSIFDYFKNYEYTPTDAQYYGSGIKNRNR